MVLATKFRMLALSFMSLYALQSFGQEVNFEKGPENTDCHTIEQNHASVDAFAKEISARSYRFTESFNISKYQRIQILNYYSCDGKSGFVVAGLAGSKLQIHEGVPLNEWDSLTNSKDIIEYYSATFSEHFPMWKPEK